jgi:hypothetical protein
VLPAAGLRAELDALTDDLPASVADRPFGRNVETLRHRMAADPEAGALNPTGRGTG